VHGVNWDVSVLRRREDGPNATTVQEAAKRSSVEADQFWGSHNSNWDVHRVL